MVLLVAVWRNTDQAGPAPTSVSKIPPAGEMARHVAMILRRASTEIETD